MWPAALLICAVAAAHPPAFWQAIAKNSYAVPAGEDVTVLARELSRDLASPDPELRDATAYSTLAAWIYQTRALSDDALRPLISEWTTNLSSGDPVWLRSFSALILSVVVARDNEHPFLTKEEFDHLLQSAEAYYASEKDLRGYDARIGWIHSVAHTADLLKFLGRSRYLTPEQQSSILTTIAGKLNASPVVFIDGEDERIARAVLSIVKRSDFDSARFATWVSSITPKFPSEERPAPEVLHVFQNKKNMLAKLYVLLAPEAEPPRTAVLTALKRAF